MIFVKFLAVGSFLPSYPIFCIEKAETPLPRISALFLTGEEGFEPPFAVLETAALPLNYSPSYISRNNSYILSYQWTFVNIFLC